MGPRRKILHILNELRFSGAEVMLACAGTAFSNAGYDSHILATGNLIGDFAPALSQAGYTLHHIPFAKTWTFFRAVRRLIRDGGYDIVHIHCERAFPIYAALAAPSARVIRTIHAVFPFSGPLRLRKWAERWMSFNLLHTAFIAPSNSVVQNEKKRFGLNPILCPNWYDNGKHTIPSEVQRNEARYNHGYNDSHIVIISIGSYIPLKNHDIILMALANLSQNTRLRHLHVGLSTDQATGRSLMNEAEKLGVAQQVTCVGETDDVRTALWAADIYVMPSAHEGMGMAAVEAMAAGLPAILSRRPGLRDFAAVAPEIIYCEPEPEPLAREIMALAAAPSTERRRIGAKLAAAMRQHFSLEAGVRRYLNVYEQDA